MSLDEVVELLRIFVGKDGPLFLGTLGSVDDSFDTYVQINRDSVGVDPFHVVEKTRGAATGADDYMIQSVGIVEHELL